MLPLAVEQYSGSVFLVPRWNFQVSLIFVDLSFFRKLYFPGIFCGSCGEGEGRGGVFCVRHDIHP